MNKLDRSEYEYSLVVKIYRSLEVQFLIFALVVIKKLGLKIHVIDVEIQLVHMSLQ